MPKTPDGFPIGERMVSLTVELEQEPDDRWFTQVPDQPGVLVYGQSRVKAVRLAQVLTQRLLADRIDHGEPVSEVDGIFAESPP